MDGNVNDIVSSVLSNPDLMAKISGIVKNTKDGNIDEALPNVVAAISENVNSQKKTEGKEEENTAGVSKILDGVSNLNKFTGSKHVALLRSLKPFMSKSRCDMIDNILKFEQLAEVIKLTR